MTERLAQDLQAVAPAETNVSLGPVFPLVTGVSTEQ